MTETDQNINLVLESTASHINLIINSCTSWLDENDYFDELHDNRHNPIGILSYLDENQSAQKNQKLYDDYNAKLHVSNDLQKLSELITNQLLQSVNLLCATTDSYNTIISETIRNITDFAYKAGELNGLYKIYDPVKEAVIATNNSSIRNISETAQKPRADWRVHFFPIADAYCKEQATAGLTVRKRDLIEKIDEWKIGKKFNFPPPTTERALNKALDDLVSDGLKLPGGDWAHKLSHSTSRNPAA